ncbi:MAG: OmpA family protein [Erythrobacter sp.]|nr:OmpA family protein [Erythrobacter sp.]
MPVRPQIAVLAGALASATLGMGAAAGTGEEFVHALATQARSAIAANGAARIDANFRDRFGWPTRHALLSGGGNYDEARRDRVARSIAAIPGVGGVFWSDGTFRTQADNAPITPLNCQEDVQALLRVRTIRFKESSSLIDPASGRLLDEVAAALRPCLGSIIAITGHTDASGIEPGNLELSRARAQAVRNALIRRGIPADGLRAQGVGSSSPIAGLQPQDPANRRIEFVVIATAPVEPTPVDLPGPR